MTTGPLTATHTYPDGPSGFTATVTVTDMLGASAATTFAVNVLNVPPTVVLTGKRDRPGGFAVQPDAERGTPTPARTRRRRWS